MTLTEHIVNLIMEVNDLGDKQDLTEEIQRMVDEANQLTVIEADKMDTDKAMVVIILKAAELYARSKWDEAFEYAEDLAAEGIKSSDDIEAYIINNKPPFNP